MPHIKRVQQCCHCTCHSTKRPTTYRQSDEDDDSHDDDDIDDELTELRAKEQRRLARRRASRARYRANHPERVATEKQRYRARYPQKVAAEKQRYREKRRAKAREACRRYYAKHREERRAYFKQRDQTEHRQAWMAQYRVTRRKAIALAARERRRTLEKIKSLGPLKLTIELEDCMKPIPVETYLETLCESLEVEPQPSFCELLDVSLTDLGDPPVWEQWLDTLLDDLSRNRDLSSSSDDSLCDLSSADVEESSLDLEPLLPPDGIVDLFVDMSPDEGVDLIDDLVS